MTQEHSWVSVRHAKSSRFARLHRARGLHTRERSRHRRASPGRAGLDTAGTGRTFRAFRDRRRSERSPLERAGRERICALKRRLRAARFRLPRRRAQRRRAGPLPSARPCPRGGSVRQGSKKVSRRVRGCREGSRSQACALDLLCSSRWCHWPAATGRTPAPSPAPPRRAPFLLPRRSRRPAPPARTPVRCTRRCVRPPLGSARCAAWPSRLRPNRARRLRHRRPRAQGRLSQAIERRCVPHR